VYSLFEIMGLHHLYEVSLKFLHLNRKEEVMNQLVSRKQRKNTMDRRSTFALITTAIVWLSIIFDANSAIAQSAEDIEGVKTASKGFYAALAVLDNGEAMDKIWAHTPYITFVGPRSKSVIVGWDDQKKYWQKNNKLFLQRDVVLPDPQIHVNGNLAWEIGREAGDVKMSNGGIHRSSHMVTNVYEKIEGRWLIVSHHAQPTPK